MRKRPAKAFTLVNPRGKMHVVGMRRAVLTDLYYFFIQRSWSMLVCAVAAVFLGMNVVLAELYRLTGGGIAHANPDSFADYFFFSVQTMSTIGYGYMYPESTIAHVLVTLEALMGLLGFALMAGMVFSKFSRPRARVIFSRSVVVTMHDGEPTLMIRMANERANYIADATLHLAVVRPKVTKEGRTVVRVEELDLILKHSPMFYLTWTAMHRITPSSPLHGVTAASIEGTSFMLICSLSGYDSTIGQTIHARYSYSHEHIAWNQRFADILTPREDGDGTTINYALFHSVEAE